MNEAMPYLFALLSGLLAGAIFFGGLWWTVRKGLSAKHPALLFSGSLLLRSAIVLADFYYAAGPDYKKLLLCLLGFVAARAIMARYVKRTGAESCA
jgi:F1F0 ATPase subunit 2